MIEEYTEELNTEIQTDDDIANSIGDFLDNEESPVVEEQPTVEKTAESPIENIENLLVKVKIQGEEKEVPISELKNGYQRQADYTQKTQELSQERQQIEQQKQQWDQYVQSIPVLANVAQQNIQQAEQQLFSDDMIRLAQEDPAEYIAHKAKLEKVVLENQRSLQAMSDHWAENQKSSQQQIQETVQKLLNESNQKLTETYGEDWTSGKIQKEVFSYCKDYGFNEAELNSIYDHRYVQIIDKARRYDELMSNKTTASKKVEKIPPKISKLSNDGELDDIKTVKKSALQKFNSGDDAALADLIAGLL